MIALVVQRTGDLAQQQHVLERRLAEELLLLQNLRLRKLPALRRDHDISLADLQEAQNLRSFHNRQQVVDLERQLVGQLVNVGAALLIAQIDHNLQQSGDAARTGMRQHLVMHLPLVANLPAVHQLGNRRRHHIRLGQHFVDVVHQLRKRRALAVPRMRQRHLEVRAHMSRIPAQHDNAIGQQHRFLDIVRDQENRLRRNRLLLPQLQQFAAQVLRRQHVER